MRTEWGMGCLGCPLDIGRILRLQPGLRHASRTVFTAGV